MSDIAEPDQPEVGVAVPAPDPEVDAQIEEIEEALESSATLVAILADSEAGLERLLPAKRYLDEQGIESDAEVIAAQLEPGKLTEFCETARSRGLKVVIAGASTSSLPGLCAAGTDLPVIGVPLPGEGSDEPAALLAMLQMPPGSPVACVAVDGAESAGVLAARIINA